MQSSIIISLNTRIASSPVFASLITIASDIFVFSYPLYLVYLYLFTHEQISRWQRFRHRGSIRQHKYYALNIFSSFVGIFIVNYIIKALVTQPRPFLVLDLLYNPQEALILNKIPTDAFPSDHAAASMTMAVATLIRAYRTDNRQMKIIGRCFLGFSGVMGFGRIATGLHRPIDILVGYLIGAIVAYLMTNTIIFGWLQTKLYDPLITFQEKMFVRLQGLIK